MAYGTALKGSSDQIPIPQLYVPGVGFAALQGSTNTNTDGSSNTSAPVNWNLTQINSLAIQMGNGDGITAANVPAFAGLIWDGANWNRLRGNVDNVSIISASGVTTTQTSADLNNYNARGAVIILDMTTVGTGSVTITIKGKGPQSSKYYTILTGAVVNTNSTNLYRIYPGLTAAANATVNDVLPKTWQVVVAANNANATTYKVEVLYIL